MPTTSLPRVPQLARASKDLYAVVMAHALMAQQALGCALAHWDTSALHAKLLALGLSRTTQTLSLVYAPLTARATRPLARRTLARALAPTGTTALDATGTVLVTLTWLSALATVLAT